MKNKIVLFCIQLKNYLESVFFKLKKNLLIKVPYKKAKPGNCGIACISMVINKVSIIKLEKEYKKFPYYDDKVGWSHDGLVKILKDYGIKANSRRFLSLKALNQALLAGELVVVSLNVPAINNLDNSRLYEKKDSRLPNEGHLCLLVGVNQVGFVIYDPRGINQYSKNLTVPFQKFAKIFTGNGIIINKLC